MTAEIIHGDCLDVLTTLPASSVDLIATDPPYYRVKGEAWDRQWKTPALFLAWLDRVLVEFARVLKPNGSLYLFAYPKMAARVEVLIGQRFEVLSHITWTKPNGPGFDGWKQKMSKAALRDWYDASERIIFAQPPAAWARAIATARAAAGLSRKDVSESILGTRSGACWNWEAGRAVPEREHWERLRGLLPVLPEFDAVVRPFSVSADVPFTDVWDFPTVRPYDGKHPCEKPVALMEHIIRTSSRPGAVVLDAFCGSGATGEAARNLGRSFIGIEKDAGWAEKARRRLGVQPLREAMDQT